MKEEKHGVVIWLTGLPGSGKTTIGRILASKLAENGVKVELFDGDEVRKQLSADLGFSKKDRELHAKRVVYVAKILSRNGINSIVTLISPYRSLRAFAREELGSFVEIYVKCSVDECIRRDPKGLYMKALSGEIRDLTGIQDPYEEPENPEIVVNTEFEKPEESANIILSKLNAMGCFW
jgi:adenylylsulfate kinase